VKGKIKTMKSRQEVTDDELHDYMNFDDLLHKRNKIAARHRTIRKIGLGVFALLSVTIALVFFQINRFSQQAQQSIPVNSKIVERANTQHMEQHQKAVPSRKEKILENENNKHASIVKKHGEPVGSDMEVDGQNGAMDSQSSAFVYVQAEPVNGYPDLYAYFDRELVYPQEAMGDSVEGKVVVIFSVDVNGMPQNIQIENSLGDTFDREVLKVMKNMPLWKPATYNGKHVNSKVSIPLTFELENVDKK
jgi:TonB family protein